MKSSTPYRIALSFVFLFTLVCLMPATATAQQDIIKEEARDNSLVDGAWAMQFQISRDFTLGSFQGLVFSGKYHLSDKKAIRLGLEFDASISSGTEGEYHESPYYDTISTITDVDSNIQSVGFVAQYIVYPSPDAAINFYFGAGPLVQFFRRDAESEQIDTYGDSIYVSRPINYNKTWAAGINGVIGVEWFAAKNISLLAEYGVALKYTSLKYIRSYVNASYNGIYYNKYEDDKEYFEFDPMSVKFGLSAYF